MMENELSMQQTPVLTTVIIQQTIVVVSNSGFSNVLKALTLNDVSEIVKQVINSLARLQGQQPASLTPTSICYSATFKRSLGFNSKVIISA